MKILAVLGASKTGNTTELMKYFEKQLQGFGDFDFEYLYLQDYPLRFCTGCHNCIFYGEERCPDAAGVREIEEKIRSADGIILASPGYMFSVTGIMKNFLDHVAYNCHRPKYFGKKAFLLSACTKWQEKTVFAPMETWASGAGFTIVGKTYIEMLPFPLNEPQLGKARKKLQQSAAKFYQQLTEPKELQPKFGDLAVFYAFRTLARLAPGILQADYRYFNEKNAYDPQTKWYLPAKISALKTMMAIWMEKRIKNAVLKMVDVEKLKKHQGGFKNKL